MPKIMKAKVKKQKNEMEPKKRGKMLEGRRVDDAQSILE